MLNCIIDALEEVKGEDIKVIQVSKRTSLFSHIVIATGKSGRQVRALGQRVKEALKAQYIQVLGIEGLDNSEWVLVDAGDILVHVMQPSIRQFYDLENLWDQDHLLLDEKTATL